MSDIPRYRPVANDKYGITDDVDGKLCEYRDYVRLKAENARLKTEVEHLMVFCNSTLIPSKELQAEVERLRKAGDAMQKSMLECGPNEMATAFHYDEWWVSYYGWNAAKEGKPSV